MKPSRYSFVFFLVCVLLSTLTLQADHRQRITFITQPVIIGEVGVLYSYDADAMSSDSTETVTYKLSYKPNGMTIDSVSGLVQWTPGHKGYYAVQITAHGDKGESAKQSYFIRVLDATGAISGQIVDAETLLPIRRASVQLFPAHKYIMTGSIRMPGPNYNATTDSLGMYSIANIDTGVYYAHAVKGWNYFSFRSAEDQYLPVWWQNSLTIIGADPILIIPDSTLTVNFQLAKKVVPQQITVSGTVADSSGTPMKNALVVISRIRPEPEDPEDTSGVSASPSMHDMDESDFGRIDDAWGNARTDSNGAYSAHVYAGFTYIASAYARGYMVQFYNGKGTVLEADRFTPSNDTTGINFTLTSLPKATSSILGSVQDSAGQGIVSRLIIFPAHNIRLAKSRTVNTDSTGNFKIENLYDGKYLLMAVPYRGYLPAFYKNGSFGVWNWKEADTISLAGQETGLIVGVVRKQAQGAGVAHGRVRTKTGKAVEGAIVYAQLRSNRIPINYAVTAGDGSYSLTGLPPENYVLFADKPDYLAAGNAEATIDYANGGGTTVPDITFEEVTAIEPGNGSGSSIPASIDLYQNYPNPFNPSTRIQYDLPRDAYVVMKLFNVIGQEVATILERNQTAGSHFVEFDASQLPSGIYFYRLQVEKSAITKKMAFIR